VFAIRKLFQASLIFVHKARRLPLDTVCLCKVIHSDNLKNFLRTNTLAYFFSVTN